MDRFHRVYGKLFDRYWLWFFAVAMAIVLASPVIAPPLKRLFGF